MAENVVHMGENSPEYIAYRLLKDVMDLEGKTLSRGVTNPNISTADRKYLLDTYLECIQAVRNIR
jgi:hypothetical protein